MIHFKNFSVSRNMYQEIPLRNDFKYLLVCFKIGSTFGVGPFYNKIKNTVEKPSKKRKLIILIVLTTFLISYSLVYQIRMKSFEFSSPTSIVVFTLSTILMITVYVTILISMNFTKKSLKLTRLLNIIIKIDKKFLNYNDFYKEKKFLWYSIKLGVIYLMIFLQFFLSLLEYFQLPLEIIKRGYFLEMVQKLMIQSTLMCIGATIRCVTNRFEVLNRILAKRFFNLNHSNITNQDNFELDELLRVFQCLIQEMEEINEVYGLILFFETLNTVATNLLFLLNFLYNQSIRYIFTRLW
nr:uncharacterized protein LOC111424036 isoform X3 [Onthophagus taurus]